MPATGNKSIIDYRLSIRLCTDGFSFLVHSTGSGQMLFAESVRQAKGETLAESLERGLSLPRVAGRSYERVTLYSTLPSTRLPLDEFRREDMLALYRLTYSDAQVRYEDMRCQVLPSLEVVEVFPLQSQVEQVLHKHYPNAQVQGVYGCLLEKIAILQQGSTQPTTFSAIFDSGTLMLVVLKNGKLAYANVFQADQDSDYLYYILMVWKLLELDAWHDYCFLYQAAEGFQKKLEQYIYNVQSGRCEL